MCNSGNDAWLFVVNLRPTVKNQHLWRALKQYISNNGIRVITNTKTKNESKGFGFVSLASATECEHALAHMIGKMLQGEPLIVKRPNRGKNRDPNFKRQSALAPTLNNKFIILKRNKSLAERV